ncbi:hypothetical protein [Leptonema illini]|uniref:Uncharacterized protein n=1 Tax=Leptonema illini DSM 21528 TaxID=929563 RepID=H2CJF9_9LEPT|nr:hypothetical protein [Leptonema illini]EHQ07116.1 hypothetical protein Lepil_2441 [Leptonema illini DSM 21528]
MSPAASLQLSFENALPLFAFLRWLFYAGVVFYYAKRGKVWPVVVASMAFYALQNLPALGDAAFLQGMYEKAERRIWASEPLTHLLLTQTIAPQTLRLFLPPLMGGLSVWLWLQLPDIKTLMARPEAPLKHDARDLSVRGMLITAIPLQMVFYRGYIETMMITVPAGLLFLHALFRAADRPTPRNVIIASMALGLAVLVHGVYFFWLPVLPLLPWLCRIFKIRLPDSLTVGRILSLSLISVVIVALMYAVGLGLIRLAGLELDWMNASGGGDGKAFVSFTEDADNPFIAYTFGSWNHIVAVFSILVYAAPLLLPMLVMRTVRMLRMPPPLLRDVMSPADAALLLLTGAFIGFITLWNFDLGFFWDFDLIFSLSIPLALLTERLWSARAAWAALLAVMQTLLWMLAFSRFF